ncbi:MAG TPA: DUF3300 domain-containing protein [Geobacteraceae bacterium]|nr:DUF3300 domain-containing protein [Geobacteraceae bacterium]
MKNIMLTLIAAILILGPAAEGTSHAQADYPGPAFGSAQYDDSLFSPDELYDLLAPIALYPDPLLAQILPAATFIDQIDEATRYIRQYGKYSRIDVQPWDVSVKAVAHYPDILFMMDQKYDWTVSLGQAFINQQQDVMDTIQRLRADALAEGNLYSTPQQEVINDNGYISIVPAEPEEVYVPRYDPVLVYEQPSPSYGFITFGIGLAIGAWLDRDCDWHGHRVFYHGWQGGGWISRARPHIHDRSHIYINNRYSVVNVNRKVIQHNTENYREELRRSAQNRRERPVPRASQPKGVRPAGATGSRGEAVHPPATVTRPAERPERGPIYREKASQPKAVQPSAPTGSRGEAVHPPATVTRPPERPDNGPLYRGRVTSGPQPAARSGYGGYGSAQDAATYRERGQSSRANMGQSSRQQQIPAQSQRSAPAQRPATSQGHLPAPAPPAVHNAPRPAPPVKPGGAQEWQHH